MCVCVGSARLGQRACVRGGDDQVMEAVDKHSAQTQRKHYICQDPEQDAEYGAAIFKQVLGEPVGWPTPEEKATKTKKIKDIKVYKVLGDIDTERDDIYEGDDPEPAFLPSDYTIALPLPWQCQEAIPLGDAQPEEQEEPEDASAAVLAPANTSAASSSQPPGTSPAPVPDEAVAEEKKPKRYFTDQEKSFIADAYVAELFLHGQVKKSLFKIIAQEGKKAGLWDDINVESIRSFTRSSQGLTMIDEKTKAQEKEIKKADKKATKDAAKLAKKEEAQKTTSAAASSASASASGSAPPPNAAAGASSGSGSGGIAGSIPPCTITPSKETMQKYWSRFAITPPQKPPQKRPREENEADEPRNLD